MYGECHAHIFMNGYSYKDAVTTHKYHVDETIIHKHFKAYKENGIDFIRDGGDNLGVSKRAVSIADEYGIDYRTPVFAIHKNGHYGKIVGKGFDTIDEYKKLVETVDKEHGDFIKIMASGILDFDTYESVSKPFTDPDLIYKMAEIAHEHNFSVMVHVNTASQVSYALDAGCESIEHGYYIDEKCMDMFIKNNAVWVPTLATCYNLIGCGRFNDTVVSRITKTHMKNVSLALDKGVNIACGSDAGAYMVYHGKGCLDEMKILKECCSDDENRIQKMNANIENSLNIIKEKFKHN